MKSPTRISSRLAAYLTAGVSAGCLAGQADAAIVVTFYGPGAQSSSTNPATPAGIYVGSTGGYGGLYIVDSGTATAGFGGGVYFTNGSDITNFSRDRFAYDHA